MRQPTTHWTRCKVRFRLQTLRRDEGRWPLLREYRNLARKDSTLPRVDDILDLYGSWRGASEDVLDPRTPEGWDLDAIYADYRAGTTQKELAKRLGVDAEQLRQVFMRAGLPKRTRQEVNVSSRRAPHETSRRRGTGQGCGRLRRDWTSERDGTDHRRPLRPGATGSVRSGGPAYSFMEARLS